MSTNTAALVVELYQIPALHPHTDLVRIRSNASDNSCLQVTAGTDHFSGTPQCGVHGVSTALDGLER